MAGPQPKPVARRQRRNKRLAVVVSELPTAPSAPRGFLAVTKRMWTEYWSSGLARLIEPATDMPALVRLFTLYDERERAYKAYRSERLVAGSQGQVVLNPMGIFLTKLDSEIRQLEDRLGFTPRARLQLGTTYGQAFKSLEDLNKDLELDGPHAIEG